VALPVERPPERPRVRAAAAPRAMAPSRPHPPVPVPEASPPPAEAPQAAPAARPVFGFSMDSTVGDSSLSVPVGDPSGGRSTERPHPGVTDGGAPGGTSGRPNVLAIATMPEVDTEACGRAVSYPPEAAALGVEGSVRLRVALDERGRVVDVKVLSGLGHGLDAEAVEALKHRCRFSPAIATDGRPVPFVIEPYIFHFEIPR
jgi:periplasmic protein TonB